LPEIPKESDVRPFLPDSARIILRRYNCYVNIDDDENLPGIIENIKKQKVTNFNLAVKVMKDHPKSLVESFSLNPFEKKLNFIKQSNPKSYSFNDPQKNKDQLEVDKKPKVTSENSFSLNEKKQQAYGKFDSKNNIEFGNKTKTLGFFDKINEIKNKTDSNKELKNQSSQEIIEKKKIQQIQLKKYINSPFFKDNFTIREDFEGSVRVINERFR
jgi:hypothetical protein